jgi:cytochrome c556
MRKLLLVGVAVACVTGMAQAADAPAGFDIIAARQAGQALVQGTFTGMDQAVKNKVPDVKQFGFAAHAIVLWEPVFQTMFPPGTEHGGKTRALPTIWSDRAGFQQAGRDLIAAAAKVEEAAKSGDRAAFGQQVHALADACTACHKKFRAP